MYLLDTDIIIGFFGNDRDIVKKFTRLSNPQLYISSLTLCELYKGAFLCNNPDDECENIFKLMACAEFVTLNREACKIFGKSYAYLSKIGKNTQDMDLMIASIAISKGLVLVTRNKRHFENIPNLKIEEW